MSAAVALIEDLRAVGCAIEAKGGDLKLARDTPLPDELLERLRRHKEAVLAHLAAPPLWDDIDWRDHFHERAAILEHDAGLAPTLAEAEALQECFLRFSGTRAPRRRPPALPVERNRRR